MKLTLTFTSPLLPDDLELLGRPASYVDIAVRSTDGRDHAVSAYYDWSANWTVGDAENRAELGVAIAPVRSRLCSWAPPSSVRSSGRATKCRSSGVISTCPRRRGTPAVGAFGDDQILRETFAKSGTIPDRDGRPRYASAAHAGRQQRQGHGVLPPIWVRSAQRPRPGASSPPMTRSGR